MGACAVVAAAGVATSVASRDKSDARCCGIVGYIGTGNVEPVLMEGIEILQNRGYDSCGMTTIANDGQLVTTKFASRGTTSDCIQLLKKEAAAHHGGHHIGIAHTRWATHGAKTDTNAHPHMDWKRRISLVHNGTIDNFSQLKKDLIAKGCLFMTETDSEVIANLIGYKLDLGLSFEEAVAESVSQLQGTWGLCVIHKDFPDRIVLARNGSPLLVGSSDGQVFIASEPAALARHTSQYLMLQDGEIAIVTSKGIDQLLESRDMHRISAETVETSPDPFPHWTLKEIFEQPQSLARALNYGGRIMAHGNRVKLGGLDQNKDLLAIRNLLLAGCGTSLYAGMYGEQLMQWLACFDQVRAIDATELEQHSLPKHDAGILLLSQSGETLDTIRACQIADEHAVRKFSIVNSVGSLLARMTSCGVYLNAGREVAVASTKAFTSQVTVLALVSSWFWQNLRSEEYSDRCSALLDALHRLPVYAGMTLNAHGACKRIAEKLKDAQTLFVLGKGFGYPVALEGALKIKEISYIHAEGFAGGALKHGPFALIDDKARTPVVMIVLGDQHAALMLNAAQQVKARGAYLICLTDFPELVQDVADDYIVIPSNGPLTALLAAIPLQLLAYELSVARGINPDKPRGLAKTVTVS
ncbi:glucosamine--fructose-6-phosphate aminotransferase (isomerizing), putative [Eimeria acervulina]|uniref:Glutamine--fructose-6-phosphate aminotransferase [isomerizing] n=1 Tax=Eimeria acervulina TaxID=5801 RepID=U6GS11_EIMAC|nr:glucosamine--fructose-6-phosphate aminotransferase (isomerizing), putative [Eimeria acervulina]CDI82980.1 glucosamine--fructose-6-phosphate aminotransferase (isomerizing), putative [Eimeria acervulina]